MHTYNCCFARIFADIDRLRDFLAVKVSVFVRKEIWLRQMLRNITILRDEKFANTYLYRMLGCLYRWVLLLWSYILIFTGIVSM